MAIEIHLLGGNDGAVLQNVDPDVFDEASGGGFSTPCWRMDER